VTFKPVAMASGEDWLMRPVLAHLISYSDLLDAKVDLYDIARMNEALDVQMENERLLAVALRDKER
jgi:hypothetical protein